jgi:hypothetical protein
MEKITLPVTLVNQIMAYLGTRPFQEVFQLIQEVQKEAQAQQPEQVATTPPETNV